MQSHGDLVSRLIMGRIEVIIWLIEAIHLLTTSPDPPSKLTLNPKP